MAWATDHRPFELVDIVDALTRQGFRIAKRGAFMELSLDMAGRKRDGTILNLAKKNRVESMRKINRALSVEHAVSRLRTWFGGPQQVQSFCTVNSKGLPKNFAPSGTPDIQISPGRATFYLFVTTEIPVRTRPHRLQIEPLDMQSCLPTGTFRMVILPIPGGREHSQWIGG